MEYIFDVNPDGETVLIKKGEFVKISGNISITENKIIATNLKVSEESTISKNLLDEMTKQASNDMEIEYKDLTELSVKIKDVYYDEDENEYEEWVTLKKVTNTNSNNSNNCNCRYGIHNDFTFLHFVFLLYVFFWWDCQPSSHLQVMSPGLPVH